MKDQDKVRLTIDFPADQHTYIKMLAAKDGVSLRQFVIDHLPAPKVGKSKKPITRKKKFDKILDDIIEEYEDELENLSK